MKQEEKLIYKDEFTYTLEISPIAERVFSGGQETICKRTKVDIEFFLPKEMLDIANIQPPWELPWWTTKITGKFNDSATVKAEIKALFDTLRKARKDFNDYEQTCNSLAEKLQNYILSKYSKLAQDAKIHNIYVTPYTDKISNAKGELVCKKYMIVTLYTEHSSTVIDLIQFPQSLKPEWTSSSWLKRISCIYDLNENVSNILDHIVVVMKSVIKAESEFKSLKSSADLLRAEVLAEIEDMIVKN